MYINYTWIRWPTTWFLIDRYMNSMPILPQIAFEFQDILQTKLGCHLPFTVNNTSLGGEMNKNGGLQLYVSYKYKDMQPRYFERFSSTTPYILPSGQSLSIIFQFSSTSSICDPCQIYDYFWRVSKKGENLGDLRTMATDSQKFAKNPILLENIKLWIIANHLWCIIFKNEETQIFCIGYFCVTQLKPYTL